MVQSLKAVGVAGNLGVHFDWGEYVIWHLGPRVKVSIDGRRETVYSDRIRELNLRWTFGVVQWDELLDQFPTELALVDKKMPVYELMRKKSGWALVKEDSLCALFARQESAWKTALEAVRTSDTPADGSSRCFP
jgi:hypothetical protein